MKPGPTLRALERFFLPNVCIVCERSVQRPDDLVCDVCVSRLRPLETGCGRCGHPMPPVGPCRFCAAWSPVLRSVASAVWLGTEARAIVHRLKYGHSPALGILAARVIARVTPHPGLLVPIPVSRRRFRRRGYNQAAVMARELGRAWKRPVAENLLRRSRDATSQTTLTPEARLANVAGAFALASEPGAGRCGPVILVDDVLTTGATLDAAARVLADAGWDEVRAVTFARALPYATRVLGHQTC